MTKVKTDIEGLILQHRESLKGVGDVLPTKGVAAVLGVSEATIRTHKKDHLEELEEGKHFVGQGNRNLWTKHGLIKLCFFVKSDRAAEVREVATDVMVALIDGATIQPASGEYPYPGLDAAAKATAEALAPSLKQREFAGRVQHHLGHLMNYLEPQEMETMGKQFAASLGVEMPPVEMLAIAA